MNVGADELEARISIAKALIREANPLDVLQSAEEGGSYNVHLLYGYIGSFVKLAYVGDVNLAAEALSVTRQTVKRHIVELEDLLDAQLFDVVASKSRLTSLGNLWLPRAQELMDVASAFLRRKTSANAAYLSTHIPLRHLFNGDDCSPDLRELAYAWKRSDFKLNSDEILPFLDRCIVYERQNGRWYTRSMGENAAFSQWFGKEEAQKSVGQPISDIATSEELYGEVNYLLDRVYTQGGLFLTEVACALGKPGHDQRVPVMYQRLMAELVDESGRPVVVSMISFIDPQRDPERD